MNWIVVDSTCDSRRVVYHADRPPVCNTMRVRPHVARVRLRQLILVTSKGGLTIVPTVPWPPSPRGPRSGCILASALAYGIKLFAYYKFMQYVLLSLLYTTRKCTERVIYSS